MLEGCCHCGAVTWRFESEPKAATSCNCTVCRRTGGLWIYGFEGEDVHVSGETRSYVWGDRMLSMHSCPTCACLVSWRGLFLEPDGRRRSAVNVRMSPPETVGHLPIDHFDGLNTFTALPRDGRTVADYIG